MQNRTEPKVALIHDYLVQYGGAEKTLEALTELFPNAPIYTSFYDSTSMSDQINKQKIFATTNKWVIRFQKFFTFLMPLTFESFDLRAYDIVISDGSAWAKSVLTKPEQLHISYIHTPPRFLYGYSVESQKRNAWYFKPIVAIIDYVLRIWDYSAAQRPDILVTNSNETKARIKRFYARDSVVIYPPVEIQEAKLSEITQGDYYLGLGRLAAYKNFDFLIDAFNKIGKKLIIAGTGAELNRLKALAGRNITLTGRVNEVKKRELLHKCKGVINLVKDEDLGIVPIEAMKCGKPVLAHKSGGHLETISENVSGMFFEEFILSDFIEAFNVFEKNIDNGKYNSQKIIESVNQFDKQIFKNQFIELVEEEWNKLNKD